MKKGLIFFLFISIIQVNHAQTDIYKLMFDSLKSITYDSYLKPSANDNSAYGDGISYAMEGSLRMYENTNELSYIEDFVYVSHEVLKNRDDFRGISRKLPVWSTKLRANNCYGPVTHQTALILIPLAHYCYISEKIHKTEFNELSFDKDFTTFNGEVVRNLYEYSQWLEKRMMETVEYYDRYYWHKDSCMLQYADDICETRYNIEGTDRQMNWGYLFLYLALKNAGTETGAFYLRKYESIICLYKTILEEKKTRSKSSYYLWPESGWATSQNRKYEDISHAGAAIDLIQFSNTHKDFIQQYSQNRCATTTFFADGDLLKFANTFTLNIYNSPLRYHNAIDGSCYFWKYPKNCEDYDYLLDYGVARWLSLSRKEIHPQLSDAQSYFYKIADYYTSYLFRPIEFFTGSMGTNLLGLANASQFKPHFTPVGMVPLDSLKINIEGVAVMKGTIEKLTKNQFSILFFQDKINAQEFKFEIQENKTLTQRNNKIINFANIGFQIKKIPLTQEEKSFVSDNRPTSKVKYPKMDFQGAIFGDTTLQKMEITDNKITIKPANSSSNQYSYEYILPAGSYIYTLGDFNHDGKDELVIYDKNSGLFQIQSWNVDLKTFMNITNCKFPQDQFIEYIDVVKWQEKTHLVVYRAADRMICIYEISF